MSLTSNTRLTALGQRLKTLWIGLGLALLVLGGTLAFDLFYSYQDEGERERDHLVLQAAIVNANLSRQLDAASAALDAIRAELPLATAPASLWAKVNAHLQTMVSVSTGIRTLLVVNAEGDVEASNQAPLIGQNFRSTTRYETLRRGSDPTKLHVLAPFKTPLGNYTTGVGKVRLDPTGRFDGYVMAIVSPDYFNALLNSTLYAPDMRVSLIHGEGRIVFRVPDPEAVTGKDLGSDATSYFAQHMQSGHPVDVYAGVTAATGEARLAVFQSIRPASAPADLPLVITPSRTLAAVYGAWRKEAFIKTGLFALIVLLSTLGLAGYQRRWRRHEEQLMAEEDVRRIAHEALQAREAELADTQRIAQVGSWHWDARSDATIASPEMCRIFGRPTIPPFAEQNGEMFPEQSWLKLQKARQEAIHSGAGYDLEIPALRADGSHFWVTSRSEVVRDADAKLIGLRGMVQDITERKQSESIAKSERFIRTITDAMPGLVAYFDRELRCRFANKSYLAWYSKSSEDMMGTPLVELLGASLFAINEPYIRGALAGEEQHFERYLTRRDGSVGHVLANYIPDADEHGGIAGFILLVTDIKALRLAEAEVQLAANVVENTVEGIMVTDADGTILSVNPAFSVITGYPAQEAVGQTPRLLRSNHHDPEFHAAVWRQITELGQWKGEIWNRRKCGEVFIVWQTITRIGGKGKESIRYISVFHDITDTWRMNESNRHLAFHDALTGLPNRALLLERLERQIAMTERQPRCLGVLFLDLDRFKFVNDTLGHAIGDDLLIEVARKLQGLVRLADTVARLGGDEFVVMLDNPANQDEVVHIANRIITVINEPMEFGGQVANVGTSIGIAIFPADGSSASESLKSADNAMYQAKHAGRNTYRLFAPETVVDAECDGV